MKSAKSVITHSQAIGEAIEISFRHTRCPSPPQCSPHTHRGCVGSLARRGPAHTGARCAGVGAKTVPGKNMLGTAEPNCHTSVLSYFNLD
jgi:hypothetical protein